MRRKAASLIIVRVDEHEILIDLLIVSEDEFGFVIDGFRHILYYEFMMSFLRRRESRTCFSHQYESVLLEPTVNPFISSNRVKKTWLNI